jgi:hypothetical protein
MLNVGLGLKAMEKLGMGTEILAIRTEIPILRILRLPKMERALATA